MENPFEIIEERLNRIESLVERIYETITNQNNAVPAPKIMDIEQCANFLSLSKSQIYKLTSRRDIPHSKRGKRIYFEREKVIDWAFQNKVKTMDELQKEVLSKMGRRKK